MSSKINTGIFFAIATLTLMVAGALYGGINNANAQQSNNVGNFASVTQSNSAVSVADASATATGGNGGYGGFLSNGGAGGSADATGGTATSTVVQSNTNEITQSVDRSLLIGANVDLRDCACNGGAQTNNVGNFATVSQSNSAVSVADASASATGGNGGSVGGGAAGLIPIGNGGAGGPATATGGEATSTVIQSNANTVTQSITQSILAGINFAR